jgi:16S rRNA (guanine966-N2)-methyltransferase
MRIVGGELKGRRFSPPKNFKARPTTDTARESLFNILANYYDFEELSVLDLFGGTGAISFEFASRGVPQVTCVENNYHHYSFIKKCIHELDLTSVVQPLKADVFTYLNKGVIHPVRLIFADPPFDLPQFDKVLPTVLESGFLTPDGLFILEHGPGNDFSSSPFFRQLRKYGKVHFSFFECHK